MAARNRLGFIGRLAYTLLRWTDIDRRTLDRCVKHFATNVPPGVRLLDAGAGLKPYASLFRHCHYESCDFPECDEFFANLDDGTRAHLTSRHNYVCSLDSIPVEDCSYDFVLCTQVLEHVPDPVGVLRELLRVLKPGATIYLSVPQGYGVHGEPFNFFYFTKYGLDLVLCQAGFEVESIKERGGYFFYLFDRLVYAMPRIVMGYGRLAPLILLILGPVHLILAYVLAPLLLLFEPFDIEKRFTLGYVSLARKPVVSSTTCVEGAAD